MKALKEFTIPFVGLKLGEHNFDFIIDNKFFGQFDYDEFNDANVSVDLVLNKKTTLMELDFSLSGHVNIDCDISNEPYNQDVEGCYRLVVKFGQEYNDENEDILILPHGEYEINIAQYVYEFIILSVPVKRVHPGIENGTLDSDILEKLEELSPKDENEKKPTGEIDPRWESLKKLLTDNK